MTQTSAALAMRSAIQKVATGPEYSKDLTLPEAHAAMQYILSEDADPVQAAVLLIALRMKRETDEENKGVLQALQESLISAEVDVDELVDVADPYDGHSRGLPVHPFIPAVLAASGLPAFSHGLEKVGPKYGITSRKVLRAAGVNVDLTPAEAAAQLADPAIGWAYLDQRAFAPRLHDLIPLRSRIIKRQVLTTVEVLLRPLRARQQTHLLTGYVHKAYPPIYTSLARHAGYDSAMIVRGVEGGVIPSLQQPARLFYYHGSGEDQMLELDPTELGIEQATRAVPLPKDLPPADTKSDNIATPFDVDAAARAAAEAGLAALKGEAGPARDALVYAAAICLHHTGRHDSLKQAADAARAVIDSGEALQRFQAQTQ
jgi:anthranilate phosphoribosyltransferase